MKFLTPVKAIRKFCVECNGGSIYETKYCTAPNCPLFPYRQGHRPKKDPKTPQITPSGGKPDCKRKKRT